MTTYNRVMEITYSNTNDNLSFSNDTEIQYFLHEAGIHLVGSYFSGNVELARCTDYSYTSRDKKTSSFNVNIDNKKLMSFEYRFQAKRAISQLESNGWSKVDMDEETVIKTKRTYLDWQGCFMMCDFIGLEGTATSSLYPMVVYTTDTGMTIQLKPKLSLNNGQWVLRFDITCTVDSIKDRKTIEDSLVSVPASDMKAIRLIFEQVLTNLDAEFSTDIDCNTSISSNTSYDCKPDSIKLVMGDDE